MCVLCIFVCANEVCMRLIYVTVYRMSIRPLSIKQKTHANHFHSFCSIATDKCQFIVHKWTNQIRSDRIE